ncbi:flavin-dependent dehydrogenase [Nocardiopsis sp. Huas11]|uniref:NAD(P)/FAD-dependent oxidoreductase n=1 Tax=Nocardiopsis sp. Huas11 TaxID=2183912 RepID=UPI000F2661B4|nr:FAD-dependent monooxygenase [Nocardiopsis sp. Huas11]RKS09357.1 flavin-dependent dehydrogenase [Nocardiopsis sp. Huas11]
MAPIGHTVVIGSGLAGLTAAAALAPHAERVTLLERDRLPDGALFRPGVPQSRHLHSLMCSGQEALERLLPGFGADLRAAGAVELRAPWDHLWLSAAGWCTRFAPTHVVPSASRELIESVVRSKVTALGAVRVREGAEAVGLLGDHAAVRGVRVRQRGGATEDLAADLVVDAGGRSSRVLDWVASTGLGRPKSTVVDSRAGYASRYYRVPEGFSDDWRIISLGNHPSQTLHGGALVPIEDGLWHVSLFGYLDDHPPTDEAGFLEFARGLRDPVLYETIRGAEPLGPVRGFRHMANERHHVEEMERWPAGLLVLGDALCALNPVYAQGMSAAALTAVALGEWAAEAAPADAAAFHRRLAPDLDRFWQVAVGADTAYLADPGTPVTEEARQAAEQGDRLLHAAMVDPVVNRTFFDVMMLVAPPDALADPDIVDRVERAGRTPANASAPFERPAL